MATIPRAIIVAVALAASLTAAGLAPAGCFSPQQPPCAFSCTTGDRLCPQDFTCGDDGLCHRDGADGVCALTAPADGGAGDADAAGSD